VPAGRAEVCADGKLIPDIGASGKLGGSSSRAGLAVCGTANAAAALGFGRAWVESVGVVGVVAAGLLGVAEELGSGSAVLERGPLGAGVLRLGWRSW
jgi:hypothetical protein